MFPGGLIRDEALMPMLSRALESTLRRALALANERRHEYATLEHLLLAMLEDPDASAALRGCDADVGRLRDELGDFLEHELSGLISVDPLDAKPTAGIQRAVQRAAIATQTAGRPEVTGADLLVALFGERESHAVHFLTEQNISRMAVERWRGRAPVEVAGPRLLIACAHESWADVEPITQELSRSAKVWATLSSLRAGEDWKTSVAEALGRSDAVVLLLTPYATDEAGGLVRELAFVLDRTAEQDKPVAAFRLVSSDLPERLAGRFWGTLPETGAAEQILTSVAKLLGDGPR
jgi:hypothetical protein